MLGSNNAALLNELGRYAVQTEDRTHRLPMPQEFIEYLKGLDQLDGAVNTPASVNENSWENLCRLRRAKIDSELKVSSFFPVDVFLTFVDKRGSDRNVLVLIREFFAADN